MSEVKYAIAILKEKLANADRHNLAYQRLSIAEMEAIWGTLEKSDKDCAALKAERDALAVECTQYKSLAERFAERADDYKSEHFGYSVFDSSNEFKQHIKTPVTDAYLKSVRADVIKQLHSEQKEWALVTWQYDSFDALKRAAVRHGDSELSGVIFMLDRIEGFATQLRAGKDGKDA